LKKRIFQKVFLIIVVFILLLNTGCWNKKELSELGIIGAVGIDKNKDNIKLTYEIVTPKRIENKGNDIDVATYLQNEGATIHDAIRNATLTYNKKLYWPHANIVYINEECAKAGLDEYFDVFNRDHDLRKYVNLFIVKDIQACDVVHQDWQKGVVPSEYIEKLSEIYSANGKAVSIKLLDFLKTYYTEGIEPVAGALEVIDKAKCIVEAQKDEKPEKEPLIEGLYAFNGTKCVGYFDGDLTRGYNVLTNHIKSGIIVTDSIDKKGKNSLEILGSKSEMKVTFEEDKCKATVSVEMLTALNDETGQTDFSSVQDVQKIEESSAAVIKNEIEKSIKKAQELKTDIFGFGISAHKGNAKKWKDIKDNWNDVFSTMEFEVKVKVGMQRAGLANEPLFVKREKHD